MPREGFYAERHPGPPDVVLLIDVAGDDEVAVAEAASSVVRMASKRGAEGFIAVSPEARRQFWLDRARTAAIAEHTNAFKINEDVVIPLARLSEYSEGIERINIEYSIRNKLDMIAAVSVYFRGSLPELQHHEDYEDSEENRDIVAHKQNAALQHLQQVGERWQRILDNFETPAGQCEALFDEAAQAALRSGDRLIHLLLRRDLRISYRRDVERPLKAVFTGREFEPVRNRLDKLHAGVRSGRLFVATHMHAGDGNVHTNIPVNSNDYQMLHEAERIVDRVMALAKSLNGVISGEHGIGLTKIRYLEPEAIEAFRRYKEHVDPRGVFNRGKLLAGSGLDNAYTPSLRLVQQEAIILEESELGALNDDVKHCLRVASVIGRQFSARVLARVLNQDGRRTQIVSV